MTIDRKAMKRAARLSMRDHRPSIYVTTLVFLVITAVLEMLSTKLQFPGMKLTEIFQYQMTGEGLDLLKSAVGHRSFLGTALNFAINIMTLVVSAGFSLACLSVSRGEPAGIGTLLDPFAFLLKVFFLNFMCLLFITLWTLLLIVPGIIAAYRYSMALFILLDDPEKGVMQCIRESKEMTYGHKWELFVLDLSFLGWAILSVIPFVAIYTTPYIETTKANYYNVLSGRTIAAEPTGDPWDNP